MFNCPYETDYFSDFAEPIPGPSTELVSRLAEKFGIHIVAGSIPEYAEGKLYNSSAILGPTGQLLGVHRKIHLFQVDAPGEIVFDESEFFSPGDSITLIQGKQAVFGVAICYDLRFPELIRKMTLEGSQIICLPGAFNTTTGPAHWKTLLRSRAIDNQVFVVGCSPARNPESSYQAYGHSMVVDPWGEIMQEADAEETSFTKTLDLCEVDKTRKKLPLLESRRPELYS